MKRRVLKVIDCLLERFLALIYGIIILVMCIQVGLRYIFASPFPWAEELSRYFFIWIVYLGAAIASRRGAHLEVDYLVQYFPQNIQTSIRKIFLWVITAFLLFVCYKGIELSIEFMRGSSYTMEWLPQGIVYIAIPLGAILMILNMWRAQLEKQQHDTLGLGDMETKL